MRIVFALVVILVAHVALADFTEDGNHGFVTTPATSDGELVITRHTISSDPITACVYDEYQLDTWSAVQNFFSNTFAIQGSNCGSCSTTGFESTYHLQSDGTYRAYIGTSTSGTPFLYFKTPEAPSSYKFPDIAYLEYDARSGDNYTYNDDTIGLVVWHFKDASCLFNPTSSCTFLHLWPVDDVDGATSHWYYLESGSYVPSDGQGHPGPRCTNKWVVFPECISEEHTIAPTGFTGTCVWPDDLEKISGYTTDDLEWRWEPSYTQEPSGQ